MIGEGQKSGNGGAGGLELSHLMIREGKGSRCRKGGDSESIYDVI